MYHLWFGWQLRKIGFKRGPSYNGLVAINLTYSRVDFVFRNKDKHFFFKSNRRTIITFFLQKTGRKIWNNVSQETVISVSLLAVWFEHLNAGVVVTVLVLFQHPPTLLKKSL
jgi:hypothetical protein